MRSLRRKPRPPREWRLRWLGPFGRMQVRWFPTQLHALQFADRLPGYVDHYEIVRIRKESV